MIGGAQGKPELKSQTAPVLNSRSPSGRCWMVGTLLRGGVGGLAGGLTGATLTEKLGPRLGAGFGGAIAGRLLGGLREYYGWRCPPAPPPSPGSGSASGSCANGCPAALHQFLARCGEPKKIHSAIRRVYEPEHLYGARLGQARGDCACLWRNGWHRAKLTALVIRLIPLT